MERINGFDYLRSFAAFSVVWIHGCVTNPTMELLSVINNYAVPAFILMSIYLLCAKYQEFPNIAFMVFFKRLVKRIIPQFAFWTIIYILLKYLKSHFLHTDFSISIKTIVEGGVAVQTWFLPAIFIWQIVAFSTFKMYKNCCIDLFLAIVLFVAGYFLIKNNIVDQGFETCIATYSGYVFIASFLYKIRKKVTKTHSSTLGIACIIFFCVYLLHHNFVLNIICCSSFFLFFMTCKFKRNRLIELFSVHSFGIYLVHFVFLQSFAVLCKILYLDISTLMMTLLNIILAFGGSFLISYVFKKNSVLSKFV